MSDRLRPSRLAEIEHDAQEALHGSLLEQAWARRCLELVREVKALGPVAAIDELAEALQRIYDSEINGRIDWIWDAGFEWKLDVGPEAVGGNAPTVARAIQDMAVAAVAHYPESEFAKW